MATRDRAKELAASIVLAQGNVFIKELLREKELRIGATKADFDRSLREAIDAGQITVQDLEEWLHRIEGWGEQYVYLYRVDESFAKLRRWARPDEVKKWVVGAELAEKWDAPVALGFPPTLSLTRVEYREGALRIVWQQGSETWVRDPTKDYEEVIEDDRYRFQASRHRAERQVVRFELRPADRLAAEFVSLPASSPTHRDALEQVRTTIEPLVPRANLTSFNVSRAIRRLDDLQLGDPGAFRTQTSRLSGQGAYVEFGSTVPDRGYGDVEPIREIRRAVLTDQVAGDTATILFTAPAEMRPARDIRVVFYGGAKRIWIRARMTAEQVWHLLDLIQGTA